MKHTKYKNHLAEVTKIGSYKDAKTLSLKVLDGPAAGEVIMRGIEAVSKHDQSMLLAHGPATGIKRKISEVVSLAGQSEEVASVFGKPVPQIE